MTNQHQPGPGAGGPLADLRGKVNMALFLARAAALPVELCGRRLGTWGEKHLGVEAAVGLLWPPVFVAFHGPAPGLEAVLLAWAGMVMLLVAHRAAGADLRRRGYECHSRYAGESWFERLPKFRDPAQAHKFEVLMAGFAAAMAAAAGSEPLARFLLIAAVAHAVTVGAAHRALAARVRGMRDAELEARYLADLHRDRSGYPR